jgi:hypothetical protein
MKLTKENYKTMNTLNITKTTAAIFIILFSINLSATVLNIEDENYINDIPFDTHEIYNDIVDRADLMMFDFEEEAYINDIPFDTKCITADCEYEKALQEEFSFDEESYIDDIPFDTECITAECIYNNALKVTFSFNDESYIDDIPFATENVVNDTQSTQFVMNK